MSIEVVQRHRGMLLEGPHWDDSTQTLIYVDSYKRVVYRYDPAKQHVENVTVGERIGAVVPTRSGRLLLAGGHRIGFLDWNTGDVETVVEYDKPKTRFNDCKCDPAGRFWAGTMPYEDLDVGPSSFTMGVGSLYCLHSDKKFVKHFDDVDISNGLAWSADGKTMYYIDSFTKRVDAFDYNVDTGEIANRREAVSVAEGLPDGMCIDSEDMIWVAMFRGSAVVRYNPKTGKKLQTIKFPATGITSCCWGGANLDELYVTSATSLIPEEELKGQDSAGCLFRVTGLGVTGAKGVAFDDTKLGN